MSFVARAPDSSPIGAFEDHHDARKAAEHVGPGAYVEDESGTRLAVVPEPYRNFYVDDTPNLIGIPVAFSPGN